MKIAIMQPYFIPYAGYFRLFLTADLFVIYDCVQFPRRSFVHRNQLFANEKLDWITLPLQKAPLGVLIQDLKFRPHASEEWKNLLDRFKSIKQIREKYPPLFDVLRDLNRSPLSMIVTCLQEICRFLDIPFNITYSSSLKIAPEIKGQERIISIAKHLHATDYINVPGGRALYQEQDFLQNDLRLHFLSSYQGPYHSILQELIDEEPTKLRNKLIDQSRLVN